MSVCSISIIRITVPPAVRTSWKNCFCAPRSILTGWCAGPWRSSTASSSSSWKDFLQTGVPDPDLGTILAHYRAHQEEPGFEDFKWELLLHDLLAGNLAETHAKIAGLENGEGYTRHAFEGTIDFLSGRNDDAIDHYRTSLKLYRKHSGKRKIFLSGCNGLFCLLALLRANDPALHSEIQAGLDAVAYQGNRYASGFHALQALLWLIQGHDVKARDRLTHLRAAMPGEPLSGACIALAEYFVDADLARSNERDTTVRFDQLKECLPLVARIHAEILARISIRPGAFEQFLATSGDDGDPIRRHRPGSAAVGAGVRQSDQLPALRKHAPGSRARGQQVEAAGLVPRSRKKEGRGA